MSPWEELFTSYQLETLREEAAKQRLVRELRTANASSHPFYRPLLARVGCWLVALGSRLQEQDGRQQTTSIPVRPC
ncbi:MAG: hypothetical protein M3220_12115 [Chloroflexota bacterium]|nr:hypothetical protein [Chloroflexota bacterium]